MKFKQPKKAAEKMRSLCVHDIIRIVHIKTAKPNSTKYVGEFHSYCIEKQTKRKSSNNNLSLLQKKIIIMDNLIKTISLLFTERKRDVV